MTPPPYPWDLPKRLRLIDVSRANVLTPAEWEKVGEVCVATSIKATEALTVDDAFLKHADNAARVKQDLQAYAFMHSATDGRVQAEAMDRALNTCPHHFKVREVMDWEDAKRVDPHQGGVGPGIALRNGLTFLRTLRKLRGRAPSVYSGKGFMDLFQSLLSDPAYRDDIAELCSHDLWVASYRWDPFTGHDYQITTPKMPTPFWYETYAWQCRGNLGPPIVPGLNKRLDGDVFFGDQDAWNAWCDDSPTKEPGLRLGAPGAATTIADEIHRLAAERDKDN